MKLSHAIVAIIIIIAAVFIIIGLAQQSTEVLSVEVPPVDVATALMEDIDV